MSAPELLTAASRGAIAVLRVRGAAALARLASACGGALPSPGELALRHLHDAEEALDEVLLVRTGEDACELHVHAAPVLVERVRSALAGSPDVEPTHGIEAEALADLARAASEAGARLLLDQARGALRASVQRLARASVARRARGCAALLERARVADFLLRPRRFLLAGPPNAGKSTLFNLLVGSDRALVSAQAGTTRDLIEAPAQLGPWPIVAVDSAGLSLGRASGASSLDALDALAERRARAELARADFVLWCDAGAGSAPPRELARALGVLATRGDRPDRRRAGAIAALEDPRGALARVEQLYRACFALPVGVPHRGAVPFRAEQRAALAALQAASVTGTRPIDVRWLGEPPRIEGPAGLL